ncbi:MAG: hypothetical protein ACRD1C_06070 [Terriglobales bacterium]
MITGEYPPVLSGIADYSAQVAAGLTAAGDEVEVWAPGPMTESAGVTAHPLPDQFHRKGRRQLAAGIGHAPEGMLLLVQYVPRAFGNQAMNVNWTRWLARPQRPPLWIVFHEVAERAEPGSSRRRQLQARVSQHMARQLRRAAARTFVSTPAAETWLQEMAPGSPAATWMPVPSNLPTEADASAVEAVRHTLTPNGGPLVASFGRFGEFARICLRPLLMALLERNPALSGLLIGAGGTVLRDEIGERAATLLPRLHAPGMLAPAAAAAHIAAADLLVQPYEDGVSGRRGTTMAALALGRCVLSHEGVATEPLWRQSQAVALAAPVALRPAAEELLANPERRRLRGEAGRKLYQEQFALDHTVRRLRQLQS